MEVFVPSQQRLITVKQNGWNKVKTTCQSVCYINDATFSGSFDNHQVYINKKLNTSKQPLFRII
jgi:hypothetical protein